MSELFTVHPDNGIQINISACLATSNVERLVDTIYALINKETMIDKVKPSARVGQKTQWVSMRLPGYRFIRGLDTKRKEGIKNVYSTKRQKGVS
jgi:hypothetical protein